MLPRLRGRGVESRGQYPSGTGKEPVRIDLDGDIESTTEGPIAPAHIEGGKAVRIPAIEELLALLMAALFIGVGWSIRGNKRIWEHLSYIGWPRSWIESRSVWFPYALMAMGVVLIFLIVNGIVG